MPGAGKIASRNLKRSPIAFTRGATACYKPLVTPSASQDKIHLATLPLPLERDVFLRTLIGHLSGALQDVVGLKEAEGFVAIVGERMGDEIASTYKAALNVDRFDKDQVRDVCLDLKRRIQGDFFVISEDEEKIVFGNRTCPFQEKIIGRAALCMMTSNVFGTIAAESLGYSKVVLEKTIAQGDEGCRVVLYVKRTSNSELAEGREYLGTD